MGQGSSELSNFRKAKLKHEYFTFYDMNKDKELSWTDFDLARQQICKMSGWKPSDPRYVRTHEMFIDMWNSLTHADTDSDGTISENEWLKMWEEYDSLQFQENEKATKDKRKPKNVMPPWLDTYIEYKFNLFDRTGNRELDVDEFEYVLGEFNVPAKDARECFRLFSQNNTKKVDLFYFKDLCKEYYQSDDPHALGTYINGKVKFDYEPEKKKK